MAGGGKGASCACHRDNGKFVLVTNGVRGKHAASSQGHSLGSETWLPVTGGDFRVHLQHRLPQITTRSVTAVPHIQESPWVWKRWTTGLMVTPRAVRRVG